MRFRNNFFNKIKNNDAWIKNHDDVIEDNHIIIEKSNHIQIYAIFDGHGGNKVKFYNQSWMQK